MRKASFNKWNIIKIILLAMVAAMGVFLCFRVYDYMDAPKSSDTFEIWGHTTMDITKGKKKLTNESIPVKGNEIIQTFVAANDRMEKFIIRFEGFAPEDTASLIVTLNDEEGEEYYRYECPTWAFGDQPYFYLIGTPEKDLKKGKLYEVHVSLDSPDSNLAICATSKKGTHDSLKTLTVNGVPQDNLVLYFCHSYYNDYDFALPWMFLILGTLLTMAVIAFVPSKIPAKIWNYGNVLVLTMMAFYLFQILDRDGIYTIETKYIRVNILLILGALLVIKGTLPWISFYVSDFLVVIWALTNYYVIQFKGEEFLLTQLSAFSTTMSVAGNYQYEITPKVLTCIAAGICLLLVQITADLRSREYVVKRKNINVLNSDNTPVKENEISTNKKNHAGKRISAKWIIFIGERIIFTLAGAVLMIMVYRDDLSHIPMYSLSTNISKEGYILSNLCVLRVYHVAKPDSYSKTELNRIVSEIEEPETQEGVIKPKNLIVIMNESFSDLEVIAPIQTNHDYMPFFRSLNKNAIKGKSFVNVFGGSTSVTEYEFLTGNTAAFLPIGANPYVGFCRGTEEGITSTLKDQGFYAVAMHPYGARNWNRNNVYPAMGFDEFIDEQGFEGYDKLRNFISDKGDFQKIIDFTSDFDAKHTSEDDRLFIFNVTMQNHGGYDSANGSFDQTVTIEGMENKETAESYLSLIEQSDSAFQYLLSHFSEVEEPTMIVMFGDHLPQLSNEFMDELYGKEKSSLSAEESNHMYTTQYIIWTNYDSDFEQPGEISINYLGSYVLYLAGFDLTHYDKFLLEQRKEVSAIGKYGVRLADGTFVSHQNLDHSVLDDYKMLEYMRVSDRNQEAYKIFKLQ